MNIPLSQRPGVLLLITGGLIGLNFPFGKLAGMAGVSPLVWALLISLGASGALIPLMVKTGDLCWPAAPVRRYAMISGTLSAVVPNLLLFAAIPHVGAGYVGLMFALSPVFTLGISVLFGLRRPGPIGLAGISLGLAGAVIVALSRGQGVDAAPLIWSLASVAIPVTLAVGNVYRTLDWPEDATPDALAFYSHGFAVLVFIALSLLLYHRIPLAPALQIPWVTGAQMLAAGLTFPVFFRLQRLGGPVLLSQIGYVAAAVGLATATLFLGERYGALTWAGAGLIAVGIVLSIYAARR